MVHVLKQSLLEDSHNVSSSWDNNEQRCSRDKPWLLSHLCTTGQQQHEVDVNDIVCSGKF